MHDQEYVNGTSTKIWNKIWGLDITSKVPHFAWRLSSDLLPCPSNLERRQIAVDYSCPVFYQYGPDSLHFFFGCTVASQVWALAGLSNLIQKYASSAGNLWFNETLLHCLKEQASLVAAICYVLWGNRNRALFDNKRQHPYALFKAGSCLLSTWNQAQAKTQAEMQICRNLESFPFQQNQWRIILFDSAVSVHDGSFTIGIHMQLQRKFYGGCS